MTLVFENHFPFFCWHCCSLVYEYIVNSLCTPGALMASLLDLIKNVDALWRCWSLSHVWHFATSWTVDCQAPLSMGFFRQEYWSGLPLPSPGDLPDPGIESGPPALQADSLPTELEGSSSISHWIWLPQEGSWLWPRWFSLVEVISERPKSWRMSAKVAPATETIGTPWEQCIVVFAPLLA